MSFDTLGLQAELLSALISKGYTEPTPIQSQTIPVILEGRDVLGGSQTGTGKTAAFTLPLLQLLGQSHPEGRGSRRPRALVLTPTRELAAQVGESVVTYGKNLPLRSTVIFGGVGMNPQINELRRGVDIIIATPGRLLDHAGQRTVDLSGIEILVLDEADRMLDMGFIHDIRRVLKLLPARRQNLLFSATYSDEIRQLADGLLHDPVLIEVARRNETAELVSQAVHPVSKGDKRALLSHLIRQGDWHQVLVFTRTKHGANRLAEQLERDGVTALAIHGNKSQNARTKALADFKSNRIQVLVATDIAARGLDIKLLPHVVNFELPNVPEDYVHRIGRTGRAGSEGRAVSLVCGEERKLLKDIEKVLGRPIPVEEVPGYRQEVGYVEPVKAGGGGSNRGGGGGNRGGGQRQGARRNAGGGGDRSQGPRGGGGESSGHAGGGSQSSSRRTPSRSRRHGGGGGQHRNDRDGSSRSSEASGGGGRSGSPSGGASSGATEAPKKKSWFRRLTSRG
ncbi:MAG: DEAD/DEAH box helicase [Verrucomicrobiales bacterium]|nr:DEAD/DEAH box helicase [Verrucomicrobiales bacterium]